MKKILISILAFIMTVSLLCAPSAVFASEADPAAADGSVFVYEDTEDPVSEKLEDIGEPATEVFDGAEDPADDVEELSDTVIEDPVEDFSDDQEEAVQEEAVEETAARDDLEEEELSADVELEEVVLLSAPSIVSCTNTESGLRLKWNQVDNASSYVLYYRTESSTAFTKIAETSATTFTLYPPENGRLYYYSVCAKNGNYLSSYDQNGTAAVYVPAVTVSSKMLRGKAILSWKAVKNASGYLIYKRTPGGSWTKIAKTQDCKYTDADTAAGKTYEYGIKAYTTQKSVTYKSAFAKGSIVTLKVPVTIAVKKVESAQTGIKVSWDAAKGAGSYSVFRKGTTGGWTKIGTTSSLAYTDKKAAAGKKYLYKIAVCDTNGFEGYCGSYKYTYYVPSAKVSSLTNNGRYVKLSWESVKTATGYRIYRRLTGKNSWTSLGDVDSAATVYKDYTDGYGKQYDYLVRAFIKVGSKTYYSCSTGTCTADIIRMQTPSVLAELYQTDQGFNVSWSMIKGATSYVLYRWCKAEGWVTIKHLTATYYIDKNVSKGVNYRYKVIARNGSYKSAPKTSDIVRIPTSIDLPEKRYLNLGWDVDPRATGGPAYYDSYATDWSGKCLVNKKVWANHNTYYGSTYKPHAGDIIVYGHENEDGRVYQHVDICVKTYDSSTGTFGVISGNWGSYFMTSPIAYVDKSWNDYTSNKSWYNTIHNIWQCKLSDTKRNALINSAYLMLEEYQKNPDYVRGQILDAMWIGPNNWCDVFVAYTIYIAR